MLQRYPQIETAKLICVSINLSPLSLLRSQTLQYIHQHASIKRDKHSNAGSETGRVHHRDTPKVSSFDSRRMKVVLQRARIISVAKSSLSAILSTPQLRARTGRFQSRRNLAWNGKGRGSERTTTGGSFDLRFRSSGTIGLGTIC